MGKANNIRLALEAEGASEDEIAETLAEMDDDRDPDATATRAGVPPLYRGVTFDAIELDEESRNNAVLAARNWAVHVTHRGRNADEVAKRRGHTPQQARETLPLVEQLVAGEARSPVPLGLFLWSEGGADEDVSGFGTGKTRIAAAIANYVLATGGMGVRWLDIVRAMTDLNLPFSSKLYGRAAAALGRPSPRELIILDDIDKQPPTDRNVQPIFALVNDCVNGEVPLLITANRHVDALLEDWGERFGTAVASRIVGHCLDVEVRGRDRRLDPV